MLYFIISCYLLLYLINKLTFIIGVYVQEKHSLYRVQYYPQFQASIGGLAIYLLWIRKDYCMLLFCKHPYLLLIYGGKSAVDMPEGKCCSDAKADQELMGDLSSSAGCFQTLASFVRCSGNAVPQNMSMQAGSLRLLFSATLAYS